MTSPAPRDPLKNVRGTKPWVVDRMIQPPWRRVKLALPPLLPPSIQRIVIAASFIALGGVVVVLFLWSGHVFRGDSGSSTGTPLPAFLETPVSQPLVGPTPSRLPPSPTTGVRASPTPTVPPTITPRPTLAPTATPFKYKVKAGDSLLGIALHFGVSVDALMKANGLKTETIYIGDDLIIPAKSP